jgi:hypothetical protein
MHLARLLAGCVIIAAVALAGANGQVDLPGDGFARAEPVVAGLGRYEGEKLLDIRVA